MVKIDIPMPNSCIECPFAYVDHPTDIPGCNIMECLQNCPDYDIRTPIGQKDKNCPLSTTPSTQSELCEDAVSRTELLHIFEENCYPVHYDHNSIDVGMTLPGIVEVLNIATSVTSKRKRGKWIYKNDLKQFFCSECGFPSLTYDDTYIYGMDLPNYCEDCGADMKDKYLRPRGLRSKTDLISS